jgi:hypothetical protein
MVEEYKRKGGKIIGNNKKNNMKHEYESSDDGNVDEDEASDTFRDCHSEENSARVTGGGNTGFEIIAKDEGK